MEKRVIEVLEKVRPMLQKDGGDVKFISASEDGTIKVGCKVPVLDVQG